MPFLHSVGKVRRKNFLFESLLKFLHRQLLCKFEGKAAESGLRRSDIEEDRSVGLGQGAELRCAVAMGQEDDDAGWDLAGVGGGRR